MRYQACATYSVLGTGVWSSAHILIGYFFSRSIEKAAEYAGRGAFLLATLIVVVVGIGFGIRSIREPENWRRAVRWTDERWTPPWLVSARRRPTPQPRFVW